jgi:hypothetical protein
MSIFWLAGLAGTGKSSIMKTFCEQIKDSRGVLMATFFASRNSAERRDPFHIIHTFAHELAVANPHIRPQILSAIQSPPKVTDRPMKEQIDRLILKPLVKAQHSAQSIVLVIDALDECDKIDGVEGGTLIPLLADALRDYPVKLLISSRQEDSIRDMFKTLSSVPLRLHQVHEADAEADVRRILIAGFTEIRKKHRLIIADWPTEKDMSTLVRLTGPLLVFAATVLKFVGEPRFSPMARLDQVMAREAASDSGSPFLQLDTVYNQVIEAATSDPDERAHLWLCQRVGKLLRTIVLLEEPLSTASLAELMAVSEQEVAQDVRALSAVLLVTQDDADDLMGPVRIFHPSFRDFLVGPQRCVDPHFRIVPGEHHLTLLRRCLVILNQGLCYDICQIQDPTLANADVVDLPGRLSRFVSEALRYASVFWPVHFMACDALDDAVRTLLLEFCTKHMLHWLELLSLLGRLHLVAKRLPSVVAWSQVSTASIFL